MRTKSDYISPLLLGALAAIITIYFGENAKIPVLLMACVTAALAMRIPGFGLLAIFPMLAMIAPTPASIGWREFSFALVLISSGISSIWRGRDIIFSEKKYYSIVLSILLVFLIFNFLAARYHNVSLADWVRGVLPFIFIGFSFPIFLEIRKNQKIEEWLFYALILSAFLFCWHVVSFYVDEKLWKPYSYIYKNSQWIRINENDIALYGDSIYQFRARVTQLLQQATDVLLPAALAWGAVILLWAKQRVHIIFGSAIYILSTAAMILTYTRSMLLTGLIIVALLTAVSLKRYDVYTRIVILICPFVVAALSTIFIFDLSDIYLNRFVLLKQAFDYISGYYTSTADNLVQHSFPLESSMSNIQDANITSRIEEYKIAFKMFLESPFIGQGFGVRHDIAFATGHGDVIASSVGYIHNWFFYFLMVGGVSGLLLWVSVLLGPILIVVFVRDCSFELRWIIIGTIILLALYGLFFAVFRLITYNLILASVWGVALGQLSRPGQKINGASSCVA